MRRLLVFIFIFAFTVITSPGFAASVRDSASKPANASCLFNTTEHSLATAHTDADILIVGAPSISAAESSLPGEPSCDNTPGNQNLNEEHSHTQDLVDSGDSAPWLHLPGIARLPGDTLHDYASPYFPIATPPAN